MEMQNADKFVTINMKGLKSLIDFIINEKPVFTSKSQYINDTATYLKKYPSRMFGPSGDILSKKMSFMLDSLDNNEFAVYRQFFKFRFFVIRHGTNIDIQLGIHVEFRVPETTSVKEYNIAECMSDRSFRLAASEIEKFSTYTKKTSNSGIGSVIEY